MYIERCYSNNIPIIMLSDLIISVVDLIGIFGWWGTHIIYSFIFTTFVNGFFILAIACFILFQTFAHCDKVSFGLNRIST